MLPIDVGVIRTAGLRDRMLKRQAHASDRAPSVGMDGRRQHGLPATADQVTNALAVDIPDSVMS